MFIIALLAIVASAQAPSDPAPSWAACVRNNPGIDEDECPVMDE